MELVKITDLTNRFDISSRSLRYYEQIGLIRSVRPDLEKYRYYDEDSVERLKQILILRKMQIPIKDILRIYKNLDMQTVVETFANRIAELDNEIIALSELKQVVNSFLQTMLANGVTQISALPLLYEKMEKELHVIEKDRMMSYRELSALSDRISPPPDISILSLPSMRVLLSVTRGSETSDVDGFWNYLNENAEICGSPGQHTLFEYRDASGQTVMLQKVDDSFVNDSPYLDDAFPGGLFATVSAYADEDIGGIFRKMLESFDDNDTYQADYRHDGRLRHEPLVEIILSPDSRREKLELFLPVKRKLPNAALYPSGRRELDISAREIEEANPVLWTKDVPMDKLIPIMEPYYRVNENGEAEYAAYISKRVLSTGVEVRLPYRVDLEFRVDENSGRWGYGSDEGSIRIYHGNEMAAVNMENNADPRLSKEALCFHQPIFGNFFLFPGLGAIRAGEYNHLEWIVGEKHLAVILNGEVRYCGVEFPYMSQDLRAQPPKTIIIGSDGQGKRYFRSLHVSQLRRAPKLRLNQETASLVVRQSNNLIPNIHPLITKHFGENYWFNGCAKYVMEALGETDYDYSFFAGLTGDNFAQIYAYGEFLGDSATEYRMHETGFLESIFEKCGYASTFISDGELKRHRASVLDALIDSINRGVPVIRYGMGFGVIVGYEDYGEALLYLTEDNPEPSRVTPEQMLHPDAVTDPAKRDEICGWLIVGEKKRPVELADLYRDAIIDLPRLLAVKNERYCFGAAAFYAWADDIEGGRFDRLTPEDFDVWVMYTVYICNLATNGSCCHEFLDKARALNQNLTCTDELHCQYDRMRRMWNGDGGQDLEALGGGFNVTLEALQNPDKRVKIAAKLREYAACTEAAVEAVRKNASDYR